MKLFHYNFKTFALLSCMIICFSPSTKLACCLFAQTPSNPTETLDEKINSCQAIQDVAQKNFCNLPACIVCCCTIGFIVAITIDKGDPSNQTPLFQNNSTSAITNIPLFNQSTTQLTNLLRGSIAKKTL